MEHQEKSISKRVEPLKTGELLVREGLIRLNDIEVALSIQENRQNSMTLKKNRLLGMILCDLNLITPVDNYYILHKYNKLKSIQSELVSKKMLSPEVVSDTEKTSQELNIPFISMLLKNKLVSTSTMQKLLFDLFHIPFRSISDFIFNEKDRKQLVQVLDKQKSLENGILPLVLKSNTMLFGITDPKNILFIKAVNDRFPQYRFKALFMPYSGFSWFYQIIYKDIDGVVSSTQKPLDLSLLLNFKTAIKDPEKEKESLQTLYEQYELLRQLTGSLACHDNRQDEFYEFITQYHKSITQEYKSRQIEFSLKKEDQGVKVMAFPKR